MSQDKTSGQKAFWTKSPMDKKSYGQKVLLKKTSYGQNVQWTKRPTDKTSYGQNVMWTKVLWTKLHLDNILRKNVVPLVKKFTLSQKLSESR